MPDDDLINPRTGNLLTKMITSALIAEHVRLINEGVEGEELMRHMQVQVNRQTRNSIKKLRAWGHWFPEDTPVHVKLYPGRTSSPRERHLMFEIRIYFGKVSEEIEKQSMEDHEIE